MKLYGFILFIVALAIAFVAYEDRQNEVRTYDFCSQFSPGNELTRVALSAESQGFQLIPNDEVQKQWFGHESPTDFLTQYVCEVSYNKNKITALAVIKL